MLRSSEWRQQYWVGSKTKEVADLATPLKN